MKSVDMRYNNALNNIVFKIINKKQKISIHQLIIKVLETILINWKGFDKNNKQDIEACREKLLRLDIKVQITSLNDTIESEFKIYEDFYINNKYSSLEEAKKESLTLTKSNEVIDKERESLISDFIEYSKDKYELKIGKKDAENLLHHFILGDDVGENEYFDKNKEYHRKRFIFYEYINKQLNEEQKNAMHIRILGITNLIETGLIRFSKNKGSVILYFDTPVVLEYLGYCGKVYVEKHEQFLSDIRDKVEKIYIFEHCIKEIVRIFNALNRNISLGIRKNDRNTQKYKQAILDYKRDVPKLNIEKFKELCQEKNISILKNEDERKDVDVNKYCIEETAFIEELNKEYFNRNNRPYTRHPDSDDYESQLKNHVDFESTRKIIDLREQESKGNLYPENYGDAKYFFITYNRPLIDIANKFYYRYLSNENENIENIKENTLPVLERLEFLWKDLASEDVDLKKSFNLIFHSCLLNIVYNDEELIQKVIKIRKKLEKDQGEKILERVVDNNPSLETEICQEILKRGVDGYLADEIIEQEIMKRIDTEKREERLEEKIKNSENKHNNLIGYIIKEEIKKQAQQELDKYLVNRKNKEKQLLDFHLKHFLLRWFYQLNSKIKNKIDKKVSDGLMKEFPQKDLDSFINEYSEGEKYDQIVDDITTKTNNLAEDDA